MTGDRARIEVASADAVPPELALRRRRRLGLGLVAFGITGLLLIGAAAVLVFASLSAVDDAATGFERQRAQILAMLGPASDSLEHAATSAANAGASLTETRDAAASAAQLTTRLAESFEGLASLGSFEVFGLQPFSDMSGRFAASAQEARTLSGELQQAAAAMGTNVEDSEAVAADLRALAEQLGTLEEGLGAPAGPAPGPSGEPTPGNDLAATSTSLPISAARLVLMGMLGWLAIPALASVWLGWRWAREGRTASRFSGLT